MTYPTSLQLQFAANQGLLSAAPTVSVSGAVQGSGTASGTGTNTIGTTLTPTGVIPGEYGSPTTIPEVTVNAAGQITSIDEVPVTATAVAPKYKIWAPTFATPGRKPLSGEELIISPITFATTLPVGFMNSGGGCEVAFTSNGVFTVLQNGAAIGTVTFPAGAVGDNVAVFASATGGTFNPPTGRLSVSSPIPQDPTGSGVFIQLLGSIV